LAQNGNNGDDDNDEDFEDDEDYESDTEFKAMNNRIIELKK